MKSIPLPVRVAAGLAATAVEQARTLPAKLAGLPVTVVSQALQASMRVQQQVTELAIRGDEVLAGLRPVEETPEWATFDEDLEDDGPAAARSSAFDRVATQADDEEDEDDVTGLGDVTELADVTDLTERNNGFAGADPWVQEERALVQEAGARDLDLVAAENYDLLSLPQLRARMRRFSVEELTELLEYERAHGNRPSFVGMLTRRIATVRDSGE